MRTGASSVLALGLSVSLAAALAGGEEVPRWSDGSSGLAFGDPLSGLAPALQQDFEAGYGLFIKVWSPGEGLGPLTSARSCTACHAMPMPGGSGTTARTFVHHVRGMARAPGASAVPRFAVQADGRLLPRPLPADLATRKTPLLFGVGLLEGVPEADLLAFADPEDADGDGISGRLPARGGLRTRFGWKGSVAGLEDFVAMAFASEMGLASERAARAGTAQDPAAEISEEQVGQLARFLRLLAAPPCTRVLPGAERGRAVFLRIGCESCHRETLRTGASSVPALAGRVFHPYTDLLVHDMGSELADGIREADVSESEFRTPPLWGLSSTGPPFLHDARASTLEEAILQHGGEASRSARAFQALGAGEREALIDFLLSL